MKHMKRSIIIVIMATFLASFAGTTPARGNQQQSAISRETPAIVMAAPEIADGQPSAEEMEEAELCKEIFDLLNQQRVAAGLPAFAWNDTLMQDAHVRAQECAQNFSHTRPNGTDWWTVDSNAMYGENIAYDYADANSVVSAWMASPIHRANEIGNYLTCAIAIYRAGGVNYFVQEFGY